MAKISEETAKAIIESLKHSSLSCPKIAEKFGVSIYIVEDIKRCKTWKYLHEYKKNIRAEY